MEYYSFKHTNSFEVLEEENLNLQLFQKRYIVSAVVSAQTLLKIDQFLFKLVDQEPHY